MVSGAFKSSQSHDGAMAKCGVPSRPILKQNFRTKTILESCISSIPPPEIRKNPAATVTKFQAPNTNELAATGRGQQPGESIMFARIHA
jgi:hypothetical protein